MVKIFDTTDTDFSTNGDIVIQPLKAKVHKEDNGDYYLDLEVGIEYAQYITAGKIAVVKTPQGEQGFRVRSTTKTQYKITAKCWHLYYDLYFNAFIYEYKVTTSRSVADIITDLTIGSYVYPALPQWSITSALNVNAYVFGASYVRCSFFDAIMDLTERAKILGTQIHAHLVRDNFSVTIKESIEYDNGYNIRYGNNLKEITKVESWDNVCTRLYPTGKEGVRLSSANPYIDSSVQYDMKYTKAINFSQEDYKREYYNSKSDYLDALAVDLRVKAESYLSTHCYPEVSYNIKVYIDHDIDIGEIIKVSDEALGVDLLTRVTSYDYDCILGKYDGVKFGNRQTTAKGLGHKLNQLNAAQRGALIGDKQLVFEDDGSVSYVNA
jgi:phage minor structural protein